MCQGKSNYAVNPEFKKYAKGQEHSGPSNPRTFRPQSSTDKNNLMIQYADSHANPSVKSIHRKAYTEKRLLKA